jgi:hypothetical protein
MPLTLGKRNEKIAKLKKEHIDEIKWFNDKIHEIIMK